jgi:hypothetical protein
MFIKAKGGYDSHGEQFAKGKFLAVFSHNSYMAEEQANRAVYGPVDIIETRRGKSACTCAGHPIYWQKSCPTHAADYVIPKVDGHKLYAIVLDCSMRQCGPWMMGSINIAGQRITVSGAYGHDGLTCDYEKLTPAAREKLVEVPQVLAETFWNGGGHNSSGKEAPAMRDWANSVKW